jgi:hypothetical protein
MNGGARVADLEPGDCLGGGAGDLGEQLVAVVGAGGVDGRWLAEEGGHPAGLPPSYDSSAITARTIRRPCSAIRGKLCR